MGQVVGLVDDNAESDRDGTAHDGIPQNSSNTPRWL